jgi:HEAT repeat protein
MDTQTVESVLAEVGKAFRLCRFYPPTHPSVQQAMADLSAALPTLGQVGLVELRIGPAGFALGTTPLLPHNPPVQEFANLLYARGHRAMALQPGVTADEVVALIRATAGNTGRSGTAPEAAAKTPELAHITLLGTARKSTAVPRAPAAGAPAAPVEGSAISARSTGVFRPNALPPEIEVHRLTAQLESAAPADAIGPMARLGTLAMEILAARDFATFAEAVAALARWQKAEDPAAADAARAALAPMVNDGTIALMIGLAADQKAAQPARQAALAALGALGERAMPALFDAYVAAPDETTRAACAGVIQAAGEAAVPHLASRTGDEHAEPVRAAATLLGATGAAAAAGPVLSALVRHADAEVRRAAIGSLGKLKVGDPRLVIGTLRDLDPGVRLEGARTAALLGDRGFGPILAGRLEDEAEEAVVLAMIEALGSLREAKAVPVLAGLAREMSGVLKRRSPAVRVAAVRALVRIGSPDALAAVGPYKTDKNADVRNAALGPGA